MTVLRKRAIEWSLVGLMCGWYLAAAKSPTAPGTAALPDAGRRLVFAHYMTCFTLDVPFCKQEIRIAQAHGLDGFAMDFGEWCNALGKPSRYVENMDNMFEAARQLGTGFKLLLTPEYSVQPVDLNVEHMVNRYYDHPNAVAPGQRVNLRQHGLRQGDRQAALGV